MIHFLLLSLLSGIIELGPILVGLEDRIPIIIIVLFPLCYQIGNFLAGNNILKKKYFICIIVTIVSLLINIFVNSYFLMAFQMILTSYILQRKRIIKKAKCPTWLKRSFRIIGFAISPVFLLANGQLIILIIVIYTLGLQVKNSQFNMQDNDVAILRNRISMVMIFHQMHYFVYTYIMPVYLYQKTGNYLLSSVAFAITWIVYTLPQTVITRKKNIPFKIFFLLGHVFLAVCLIGMTIMGNCNCTMGVLLCWLLTGLGGGTVFCIQHLSNSYEQLDMTLSENIGHVLGPILAAIICIKSVDHELVYLTAAAFLLVILALVAALINIQEEEKNE